MGGIEWQAGMQAANRYAREARALNMASQQICTNACESRSRHLGRVKWPLLCMVHQSLVSYAKLRNFVAKLNAIRHAHGGTVARMLFNSDEVNWHDVPCKCTPGRLLLLLLQHCSVEARARTCEKCIKCNLVEHARTHRRRRIPHWICADRMRVLACVHACPQTCGENEFPAWKYIRRRYNVTYTLCCSSNMRNMRARTAAAAWRCRAHSHPLRGQNTCGTHRRSRECAAIRCCCASIVASIRATAVAINWIELKTSAHAHIRSLFSLAN